jgi:uncharacterized protein YwgA
MTATEKLIGGVVAAGEGEIIGRIRLQKIFYLLEQSGLASGLSFHYHHYGPYSRDLDFAIGRAEAFEGLKEEIKYRKVDGIPFSVFRLAPGTKIDAAVPLGSIPPERARTLIRAMKQRSSTVLELAATIHWLINREKVTNWKAELVRRKGIKTEKGRTEEALALLDEIGLPVT